MSPLQQRMREDMQLRGLSARTQEAYARAVWQLAQHYHRSPAQLSDDELRQYFLYLTNQKKIARPTGTIAICVGSKNTPDGSRGMVKVQPTTTGSYSHWECPQRKLGEG